MADATPELIFEEPPTAKRGRSADPAMVAWLDALRAHPGQWAKYPIEQLTRSLATRLNKAGYGGFEAGDFEATARKATNNRVWLYARYVGKAGA